MNYYNFERFWDVFSLFNPLSIIYLINVALFYNQIYITICYYIIDNVNLLGLKPPNFSKIVLIFSSMLDYTVLTTSTERVVNQLLRIQSMVKLVYMVTSSE